MESNTRSYNHVASFGRLDEIINASDSNFQESDKIPDRSALTFTNGFYVKATALFADIRDSSGLPSKYRRPTLARIYRSYVSELVAVCNGNRFCAEINIVGDCVSAIFNGQWKEEIQSVFSTAAKINSLVKTLNYKLQKRDIEAIRVGIGLAWGRALMIKAGYSGSGVNDVVWMGDVVNEASTLSGYGSKGSFDAPIMVSNSVYENLGEKDQSLLKYNSTRGCYQGNVINVQMNQWYQENCT